MDKCGVADSMNMMDICENQNQGRCYRKKSGIQITGYRYAEKTNV